MEQDRWVRQRPEIPDSGVEAWSKTGIRILLPARETVAGAPPTRQFQGLASPQFQLTVYPKLIP